MIRPHCHTTTPRKEVTSCSTYRMDPDLLFDHNLQLQNWICSKTVNDIQRKSNVDMRETNSVIDEILQRENTFVKDLDDMLSDQGVNKLRKTELLNKRWSRQIHWPLTERIQNIMEERKPETLRRRKLELHQEYIDYINRRDYSPLDVYSPDEYYPFRLNPVRSRTERIRSRTTSGNPASVSANSRNTEDRTIMQCETGSIFSDNDLEVVRLPPPPLVPLGRQGTSWKTWTYMPHHDINSDVRLKSRRRMRGDFNRSSVSLTDRTTKLPRNIKSAPACRTMRFVEIYDDE